VAKIPKKVQVIADDLQKVEKVKAPPAVVEVHAVEPVLKGVSSFSRPKGKTKKTQKQKKEVHNVLPEKESSEKEKRAPGYAGLARRIAGRLVGEIRGKPKFWFDD